MSRGPGTVERQLRDIFANKPEDVFNTSELCELVYGVKAVRKKHRVAVLRALKRLARRSMPTLWRKVQKFERDDVWYDCQSLPGSAKDRAPASEPRPRKR